jgi:hypothetical protein
MSVGPVSASNRSPRNEAVARSCSAAQTRSILITRSPGPATSNARQRRGNLIKFDEEVFLSKSLAEDGAVEELVNLPAPMAAAAAIAFSTLHPSRKTDAGARPAGTVFVSASVGVPRLMLESGQTT